MFVYIVLQDNDLDSRINLKAFMTENAAQNHVAKLIDRRDRYILLADRVGATRAQWIDMNPCPKGFTDSARAREWTKCLREVSTDIHSELCRQEGFDPEEYVDTDVGFSVEKVDLDVSDWLTEQSIPDDVAKWTNSDKTMFGLSF